MVRALHPIIPKFNHNRDIKFGSGNLVGRNISVSTRKFVSCPFSVYFMKTLQYWNDEISYHFEMSLLWNHTKLWNCHTQIDIYPRSFASAVWFGDPNENGWYLKVIIHCIAQLAPSY